MAGIASLCVIFSCKFAGRMIICCKWNCVVKCLISSFELLLKYKMITRFYASAELVILLRRLKQELDQMFVLFYDCILFI